MTMKVDVARTEDELAELVLFHDRVYEYRDARWPALLPLQLPTLLGQTAFSEGRSYHPLVAREGGEIVARAVAVVDQRHIDYWNERLGHITMFEALPGTREAVRLLMDEACAWLREHGVGAARAGFGGGFEFPFAIDDYETLPPSIARQNPAYYHALLKDAGFESERGWVDYIIPVTPELVARWEGALEAARVSGFDIVPLGEVPLADRVPQFTDTWNDTFRTHWGFVPFTEDEVSLLLAFLGPQGMFDLSVLAYDRGRPVGVLWVTPPDLSTVQTNPGREIREDEKRNFLGIGVREEARGRGVNTAMSAYAFLELAKRGYSYVSYTLVLDDNWPSRRTGEKLGGYVCANYMVYRRNFRPRPS